MDKCHRFLVHLGCGPFAKPTRWIDYDGSWNARVNSWPRPMADLLRRFAKKAGGGQTPFPSHIRYLDIRKRFPFDDQSVDVIYAAHVWEHLAFSTAIQATQECYRVLKTGGVLRLVVPNLRDFVEEYLNSNEPDSAMTLNRKLHYRSFEECRSLIYSIYLGFTDFHHHRFMYDPPQLISLLKRNGFTKVSERRFLESQIEEIIDLESEMRIGRDKGFVIEALKLDRVTA